MPRLQAWPRANPERELLFTCPLYPEAGMKGKTKASILAVAAAATLLGCASKGPVSSASSPEVAAQEELAAEYQSLIDNVTRQTVCEEGTVTGSRILKREVCRSLAQREGERERAFELMQGIQERAAVLGQSRPGNEP
jgi:hypothetical protein